MVDRTVIPRASSLLSYYRDLTRALDVVNRGGRITAFTIAIIATNEEGMTMLDEDSQQSISAEGIVYPPQMIDAIRVQLQTRINHVNSELSNLGVTT